jgi:chromosome partitioning protein
MTRTIAIASQKGGVGKTTTAINLAVALGFAGRRSLVVDLDPQANATAGLGVEHPAGLGVGDALLRPDQLDRVLVQDAAEGVDMLPSGGAMRMAEVKMAQAVGGRGPLANILSSLAGRYDFVLVDCPPSLGALTTSALLACQDVLVPMQCEFYALQGLAQVVSVVEALRGRSKAMRLYGILFTMFDASAPMGDEVVEDVRHHFADTVFRTLIPRDPAVSEAPSHGVSVLDYDLRSRGARAYLELAREVLSRG